MCVCVYYLDFIGVEKEKRSEEDGVFFKLSALDVKKKKKKTVSVGKC